MFYILDILIVPKWFQRPDPKSTSWPKHGGRLNVHELGDAVLVPLGAQRPLAFRIANFLTVMAGDFKRVLLPRATLVIAIYSFSECVRSLMVLYRRGCTVQIGSALLVAKGKGLIQRVRSLQISPFQRQNVVDVVHWFYLFEKDAHSLIRLNRNRKEVCIRHIHSQSMAGL